ncbi:dihydrofolate reductase family protein [Alkalihalobacillus pseudalcaliphilus]|uniref:dihydrofolate reductase family protein n=1 Tax=Alkalihalobacillus pseudalcaliphilus TaxID=79884 RepID=UPI00064D78A7|nr:dihydrofolate reductase family protein [Alkalihalobacillus pseudalcaliphilus]KMK76806.1 hypothetical protein AB990_07825 [Alkalihalobacillus pseudalcaliphilus]
MRHNRNIVLFIATSLDGYIATEDEQLDWLFEVEGEGDNGISDFYSTIDTVLMGRKTYDWILKADDVKEYPYSDKASYVFNRTDRKDLEHTHFINEDVESFVQKLKEQPGERIWLVGGGELVATFLEKGLIDEVIMTVAPKLIGSGIPLFQKGDYQVDLELKGVQTFNQFVELHYIVKSTNR